jgi:iron complex outermembrane recepter protein
MNAPIKPGAACAILAATLAFSLIFAANAFAQEAEAERVTVTGEPVTVTGSLIPTSEEVGSNPVSILDRDLINKSGQGTTTEQLLKSLPIASANSIPVQNNATGAGGPPGAASVSLRGFDPGATLVLIDGRRVAPYPGTSPGGAAFFDLNTIPIAAVQSIEIQKDGASTTYGGCLRGGAASCYRLVCGFARTKAPISRLAKSALVSGRFPPAGGEITLKARPSR